MPGNGPPTELLPQLSRERRCIRGGGGASAAGSAVVQSGPPAPTPIIGVNSLFTPIGRCRSPLQSKPRPGAPAQSAFLNWSGAVPSECLMVRWKGRPSCFLADSRISVCSDDLQQAQHSRSENISSVGQYLLHTFLRASAAGHLCVGRCSTTAPHTTAISAASCNSSLNYNIALSE